MLTIKMAADDPVRMCGGQNVSPALSWSGAPPNTKSFVVLIWDPVGSLGAGSSHVVAYGVPPNVTSFAEGDLTKGGKFVAGKGTRDNPLYVGPCPPMGDAGVHYYVFSVIATDLEPDALKPGMTREQVYSALAPNGPLAGPNHALRGAAIVAKYAR